MDTAFLSEMLEVAKAAAQEAGQHALRYFQTGLRVETKQDHSPVTVADRECEQMLRERIARRFPAHGITGEEFGSSQPGASIRWWLDPIDGTQSFVRGAPLFGVMVGVEHDGEAVLGVVDFPALGETVWARRGGGAWWSARGETRQAQVSTVAKVCAATLLYTDPRGFAAAGKEKVFQQLRAATKFERTWGDCYGHILVATGRAEVMVDPLLNPWDACALIPIVEEAGGRFFGWGGATGMFSGSGISTNAAVAEEVLRLAGQ